MARYFKYDRHQSKHQIYSMPVYNQRKELVGYRAEVHKIIFEDIHVVKISDYYPELKWKIFTGKYAEKEARETAIKFFENLKPKI